MIRLRATPEFSLSGPAASKGWQTVRTAVYLHLHAKGSGVQALGRNFAHRGFHSKPWRHVARRRLMQRCAYKPKRKVARTMTKTMEQVMEGIILFHETRFQPNSEQTKSIERKCAIGYCLVTSGRKVMLPV